MQSPMEAPLTLPMLNGPELVTIIFYLIVIWYVIYTCVLAYHWLTYGHSRQAAILNIAVFLLITTPLIVGMSITLQYL